MEGPRAAKADEFKMVEDLANRVFRSRPGGEPTMFQEYPLLYDLNNIENMRVVVEDGKPVANINYLPQEISIYGQLIKVATLGGVATLEEYRGKGYGTALLNDCILRMTREQDIDVLHVSGNRSMYRRAGCLPAGRIFLYNVKPADPVKRPEEKRCHAEYEACALHEWAQLYTAENVRFIREYDQFGILLNSRKFRETGDMIKKQIMIKQDGIPLAYMIFVIKDNRARILDCAGQKQVIIEEIPRLLEEYNLESMEGYILEHEKAVIKYCRDQRLDIRERRLDGTIRLINYKRFMERLRPYFREIYDNQFVNGLAFENDGDGICFIFHNNGCKIPDRGKQNDLIFGGGELAGDDFSIEGDERLFFDFFRTVFPIAYVYTNNLNYV